MSSATAEGLLFDVPQAEPKENTVAWVRQEYHRYLALSSERKGLLTQAQAAAILGVSRQRVFELVAQKRLNLIEILDGRYVFGDEVLAYASEEKSKGGRPSKLKLWTAALDRS
jgi:predicted XRE-type DNA-binding protein